MNDSPPTSGLSPLSPTVPPQPYRCVTRRKLSVTATVRTEPHNPMNTYLRPCVAALKTSAARLETGWLLRSCLAVALALILAVPAALAQAGAGTVNGRVLNSATGAFLRNAQVELVGTGRTTLTGAGGNFSFPNVPAGDVRIAVTYTGLDRAEQVVTLSPGGSASVDVSMTSDVYGDRVELDAFVVAAQREGNAKAIVDQREATNIKTVIAADAFGSVSEDNVGEFLKYMSGLSIDYVENDARQVRVRGMSAKYASVSIDGNPVASADFGIATGRSFQFEQVSLSTIDTLEVNKTPLADQPADSLAGTINVKSKSALDQQGRRIRYSANLTINELAATLSKTVGWDNEEHFKALPGGNLEFSDTFLDGKLGVVAAINHTGTYVEQKIIANMARTFDSDPANNETEIPRITQVNWQDGLKPTFRDSVLVNLDYKVSPDMILSLRTSYNAYNAPFHNRNWTFNASANSQTTSDGGTMATTATSATDTTNTLVVAGTNFRKYGATFSINPAIAWNISDNLTFDGSVSYSRSYQWYDSDAEGFFNIVSARMRGVSWGIASSPGSEALQLTQGRGGFNDSRSFFDLANYNDSTTAQVADRNAKDQFYTARADWTLKLPDLRMPTVLKFGASSRLLVKDIENHQHTWSMNVNPATGGLNLNNFVDPYTPDPDKGQSFTDLTGRVGSAVSLDKWSLYQEFLKYNTDRYTVTPAGTQPFTLSAAQVGNGLRFALQNMWDLEETINSAYTMANVTVNKNLTLVAGIRFEDTTTKGRAYDDIGGPAAIAASGTTNTNDPAYIRARFGQRSEKKQSYDDLFPSMQIRYTPNDKIVFRGAYYRSILRPDVQNIARSLVINDTQTTFTTANPDLKPEYADNFDVRIEYYFEPVGVISAGIFHKQIKDIQYSVSTDFTLNNVPPDILELGFVPADLVASGADFSRAENGPDTSVSGFELDYSQQLSFLPGRLSGLGVFGNYTYTDMEEEKFFFGGSGVNKNAANAGFSYRQGRFNGQVKFNWVGERTLAAPGYITNAAGEWVLRTGANSGVLQYEKERLQIDVNAEYQFHRSATLFLNIANLTGEPSVRYSVNENNLIRHGHFGAKFTIGVKGSF